jgi:hypothetical protein
MKPKYIIQFRNRDETAHIFKGPWKMLDFVSMERKSLLRLLNALGIKTKGWRKTDWGYVATIQND